MLCFPQGITIPAWHWGKKQKEHTLNIRKNKRMVGMFFFFRGGGVISGTFPVQEYSLKRDLWQKTPSILTAGLALCVVSCRCAVKNSSVVQ